MTSKHTRGPWEMSVYAEHVPTWAGLPSGVYGWADDDTDEPTWLVADFDDTDREHTDKDEAIANARLIAASPDLLLAAQAQEILDRFIGNPDYSIHDFIADAKPLGYDDGAIQGGPEDWVAEIRRAAIAKAKGATE